MDSLPMRRWTTVVVLVVTTAMACTGQPGEVTTGSPAPTGPAVQGAAEQTTPVADGIVRLQGCEPSSLLPASVQTACGAQVVQALFSQLVELDVDDSTPRWGASTDHAVATRVTSEDAQTWTIEVEDGWTFHDGTPVTASSFVDAWNFAASGPNAQPLAFLFEPIAGFDALNCPEPGCEPEDDDLDGVRLVDESTFEVELVAPDRSFPRRLAHVAFSPLPPSALEDPEAWVEEPIGNGPLRMEGAWQHDELIALRAYEDYVGPPARAAGVDVRLYDDPAAAWQDLTDDRLDVATRVPPAHRAEARGSFEVVDRAGSQVDVLVLPSYRAELSDPRLAQALSRAIDRQTVIRDHLGGLARPALGIIPAVVAGEADRCGTACRFDPAGARALLAEVGLPSRGIEIWFDRDAEQAAWVQAVAAQWREHLHLGDGRIRVRGLSHTSWVAHLQDQRVGGAHPLGWRMDVASAGEYIRALHAPNGLFNFDRHQDPRVPSRLQAAATADTDAAAQQIVLGLEQAVLEDLHHIPLWVHVHEVFHSRRVAGVRLDGRGLVRLVRLVVPS